VKGSRLEAEDRMDDGSAIKLVIEIDSTGKSKFDFEGTSPQVIQILHENIFYI
jgi:N-methylhydantoinase B/oxoprolinase/acetone carboxylase alpha subunit